MAGLWTSLGRTMRRLEAVAAAPHAYLADEHVVQTLPALQYALHTASELAHGIDPPRDAEADHTELAAALADARDATAAVVDAVTSGGVAAALPLVPEWRGALFRIRLARMRVGERPVAAPRPEREPVRRIDRAALAATSLVVAGTSVVTCGAVVGLWPVWAIGLALVAAGLVVYRP